MWAENDWIKMKKLGERTEWKWGYEKRTLRFCVLHDRLEEMVLLRALAMWKILHVILLCHRWLRRIFGAFFWNTEAGISLICHKRWFTASKAECNSKKKKKRKKKKEEKEKKKKEIYRIRVMHWLQLVSSFEKVTELTTGKISNSNEGGTWRKNIFQQVQLPSNAI